MTDRRRHRRAGVLLAGGLAFGSLLIGGAALAQSGLPCDIAHSHVHGCLATVVQGPGTSESGAPATKEGRACAWNLLRLVALGDMRISTARRNGGITQLASVDYDTFELIPYYGLFSRYCTVARGN